MTNNITKFHKTIKSANFIVDFRREQHHQVAREGVRRQQGPTNPYPLKQ